MSFFVSGCGEFSREFSRVVFAVPVAGSEIAPGNDPDPGPNDSSAGMSSFARIARTDRSSRASDGSVCLFNSNNRLSQSMYYNHCPIKTRPRGRPGQTRQSRGTLGQVVTNNELSQKRTRHPPCSHAIFWPSYTPAPASGIAGIQTHLRSLVRRISP